MTDKEKEWIDNASYESLLSHWRFAPVGDPMFQGDTGKYYAKVMAERRDADPDKHVRSSKTIGWER